MVDFAAPEFSRKQVVKAGKALGRPIPYKAENLDEIIAIFRAAHDWRNSHAFPMRRFRLELGGRIRRERIKGLTSARLKRMSSIRKKLMRLTTTLPQIQDIGGCRAVVDSMDGVRALIENYRNSGGLHKLRRDRSYIETPKEGGYRSHHLVFEFIGADEFESVYNDRIIEIQIRTRLQHAWATAVEAMGLVRNEDLKAGEGDGDWLRFFRLVSSEFAEAEECAPVLGDPSHTERVSEIKDLNRKLRASATLRNLNNAVKDTENVRSSARYFLVSYDNVNNTVTVTGFEDVATGSQQLSDREGIGDPSNVTSVLVEVDKIGMLREAYPNYFLDVNVFADRLSCIIAGRRVEQFSESDINKKTGYDLSWVNRWMQR